MDEFVGVRGGADRDGDSASGDERRRSAAGREGVVGDPLGRQRVELGEACTRHRFDHSEPQHKEEREKKRVKNNSVAIVLCFMLCCDCYGFMLLFVLKREREREREGIYKFCN